MTDYLNRRISQEHRYEADTLDEEIARALAVDPSPDFVRRVRTRIAEEPRVSAWRLWPLAGATLATVVVAAAYFVWAVPGPAARRPQAPDVASVSAEPAEPPRLAAPTPTAEPAPTAAPARKPLTAESRTTAEHRHAEPRRATRVPAAPAPSQELAGLLAFRNSLWSGRVGIPDPSVDAEMAAPLIAELAFEPIAIQPLPDLDQVSGGRPW